MGTTDQTVLCIKISEQVGEQDSGSVRSVDQSILSEAALLTESRVACSSAPGRLPGCVDHDGRHLCHSHRRHLLHSKVSLTV